MKKKGSIYKLVAFSLAIIISLVNMPQMAYASEDLSLDELSNESTVEEPTVEEPVVEEPVVEEPTVEEPTTEEPVVEEPTTEESTVEEPTVEEPVVEETKTEEPTVEEPTVEESTTEEPIVEEPTVEEPVVEEPVVEEPTVEEILFTVTFVDSEGNEISSLDVKEISEIVLPEAPEMEGFTFIKWDVDLETLELTEDITIKPVYEEVTTEEETIRFIITFVDTEENIIDTQEVEKVEEIILPEAPEVDGFTFIKWDIDLEELELTEDITIKPIYEEIETVFVEKTLETTVDDKVVSIIGNMPENAEIVVNKVTYTQNIEKNIEDAIDGEVTVTVYEAFDIKIKVDGEEYQPNEFDEAVVVSIKNIEVDSKEGEELKVFHIDDSNNIEEVAATVDANSNEAEFEADSFSVYVVAGVSYDTENGTLLDNDYATAYLYDDGTLIVTAFKQNGSSISDYPWNDYLADIIDIEFDNNITFIGDYTFPHCAISEVVLPDECKIVGIKSFANIIDLENIILNSKLEEIKESAFECYDYAFYTRTETGVLSSITCTFNGDMTNKVRTVSFPDSLRIIGKKAFYWVGLTDVSFGSNLEYIGEQAFYLNHLSTINIPGGNNLIIETKAFGQNIDSCPLRTEIAHPTGNDSTLLESVYLGDGIIEIGEYAFYADNGIDTPDDSEGNFLSSSTIAATYTGTIELSDSITTIGEYAFKGVKANVIKGGSGITNIGAYAFQTGIKYKYGNQKYDVYVRTSVETDNELLNNLLWKTNNYRYLPVTISFETDGGDEIDSIKIPYYSLLGDIKATKEGETFYKWTISNGNGGYTEIDTSTYYFTTDTTLYVKWLPKVYFELDGGYFTDELKAIAPNLTDSVIPFQSDGSNYNSTYKWGLKEGRYIYVPTATGKVKSDSSIYAIPKKDGYKFTGYTLSGDYSIVDYGYGDWFGNDRELLQNYFNTYVFLDYYDEEIEDLYKLTGDVTLTANWVELPKQTYDLCYDNKTFIEYGDSGVALYSKLNGYDDEELYKSNCDAIYKPADPVREGYTFLGWSSKDPRTNVDAKNYIQKFDKLKFISWTEGEPAQEYNTSTATFYALWEQNECTVSFDTNGAGEIGSQTLEPYSKVIEPTEPTKAGYEFKGWFTDDTFTTEWDFENDVVTSNITLVAKWDRIYTVNFTLGYGAGVELDGSKTVPSQSVTETELLENPGNPTMPYNDFKSWNITLSNGQTYAWDFDTTTIEFIKDKADTSSGSITIWAAFQPRFHDISFNTNGGSNIDDISAYEGLTLKKSFENRGREYSQPTNGYHEFKGWYTDAEFNTAWDIDNDIVLENMTLYAKWELPVYSVSFNTNGGSTIDDQNIGCGLNVVEPTEPTKTGYEFKGWYKDENFNTEWNFDTDIVTAETTLYAKWKINEYIVTFDSDGGSSVTEQVIEYSNKVLKPADPTRTKYFFDGWFVGDEEWDFNNDLVTDNITLKAHWTYIPDQYQFTFNSNGGGSIESQLITEGSVAARPNDPERKGHTFKGWFTDSTFAVEYDFSDVVTGNTTVIAKWEINEYTISFHTQGGTNVDDQKITYGGKVTEPYEPSKEGHTFRGWYKDTVGLVEWDFDTDVVEEDRTLFAVWDVNTYLVEFDSNGGSFVRDQEVKYNTTAVKPENPTKEGYKFKGWYVNGSEYDFNTPIQGGITLKAEWEEIIYQKVTFVTNCEQVLEDVKVEKDTAVKQPTGLSKSGYELEGWYTEAEFITKWNFNDIISEDITLYAKWVEKKVEKPEPTDQKEEEPTPSPEEEKAEEPTSTPEEEPTSTPEIVQPTATPINPTPSATPMPIIEEDETVEPQPEPESDEVEEVVEATPVPTIEPTTEIVPDKEPVTVVEEPLLVGSMDDDAENMKGAMAKFVEAVKTVGIVLSISLLLIVGILGLFLILLAWMKRVKVMNDHNTDEYAEEKYEVVYKTSVKTEGNRIAELFRQEDRVWMITIPEEIISERVTDYFKVVLKKGFCKHYNGEQLVIILENEDEEKVKTLGFVIDKEEQEIKFVFTENEVSEQ